MMYFIDKKSAELVYPVMTQFVVWFGLSEVSDLLLNFVDDVVCN